MNAESGNWFEIIAFFSIWSLFAAPILSPTPFIALELSIVRGS